MERPPSAAAVALATAPSDAPPSPASLRAAPLHGGVVEPADDFLMLTAAPAYEAPQAAEGRSPRPAIAPDLPAPRREASPESGDAAHARQPREVKSSQPPGSVATPRQVDDSFAAIRQPAAAPAKATNPTTGPTVAANPRRAPSPPPPFTARRSASQPPPLSGVPRAAGAQASGSAKPATLPPSGPHAELRPPPPPPVAVERATSMHGPDADPLQVAEQRPRSPTGATPPPTRIQRAEGLADRQFTPPRVLPVPESPEPGLVNAAKYSVSFMRARWQRRGAIKTLGSEIKQDTEALDQVLGALGREARSVKVAGHVFSAENSALDGVEQRRLALAKEAGDVESRKADENSKFLDVERERNTKLVEAEKTADEASTELQQLEGQRRSLRDKRKELERRQKTYLKNAEDDDRQAASATMGEARQDLRRSAEGHRKEAAALEPERQVTDRKLAALERPIGEAVARLDAERAELDAAKRSLTDAREGHSHRLAELDAEHKRTSRELGLAEAEIQCRLVTLGTLVNLNRIEHEAFAELYERIDRIRVAITARTTEIDKLTAEREAYDRGALVRGTSTIGGTIVLLIALIVIARAMS